MDDPDPAGDGFRGWADLVAEALAAGRAEFGYANLAVRGRLFAQVAAEQVPAALAMRPALVSFAAGGNDVLRRSFEPDSMLRRFDEVVAEIRGAGAELILFRFADLSRRLPGGRFIAPRATLLNEAVVATADRHGATVIDLWSDDAFDHPELWSVDRLHLSSAGHRRVAAHVLTGLGMSPDPQWWEEPSPTPAAGWWARRTADVVWTGQYLAPWVKRRLTGRSSGDLVTAKRPRLTPLRGDGQVGEHPLG